MESFRIEDTEEVVIGRKKIVQGNHEIAQCEIDGVVRTEKLLLAKNN